MMPTDVKLSVITSKMIIPLFWGCGFLKGRKAFESCVLAASQKESISNPKGSGGRRAGND
ncbi:MAG: hypothetical protein ACK48I_08210 [Bacteroidota bacterium]